MRFTAFFERLAESFAKILETPMHRTEKSIQINVKSPGGILRPGSGIFDNNSTSD